MASLSLLAKYSCLFSRHSTVRRRHRHIQFTCGFLKQLLTRVSNRQKGKTLLLKTCLDLRSFLNVPRVRKDFSRSPFTSFLMLSFMSYGLQLLYLSNTVAYRTHNSFREDIPIYFQTYYFTYFKHLKHFLEGAS